MNIFTKDFIRKLCIQNNWFTCGNNSQYSEMWDMWEKCGSGECDINDVVTVIWICSDREVWNRKRIAEIISNEISSAGQEIHKTLFDFLSEHQEDEVTVYDSEYDTESYFYYSDDTTDDAWDNAMMQIAKKLTCIETDTDDSRVSATVNLSEVIEKNIDNGTFEKLFIRNNIDSIMHDIQNIFSGYVSEEWLTAFANSLI